MELPPTEELQEPKVEKVDEQEEEEDGTETLPIR